MFKRTTASAVILLSFMPLMAQEKDATDTTATSLEKTEVLWHEAKVVIPTRVVFPPEFDAKRAHTLIVMLHGFGGSAEKAQRTVGELAAMGFLVALPEAPYPLLRKERLGYGWTLFHQGDPALTKRASNLAVHDRIPPVVTDLRQRYRIDRVYVMGFSEGALIALMTGIYNSGVFDGVVSFCPPGFDGFRGPSGDGTPRPRGPSWFTGNTLAAGSGVRVLLVHGRKDSRAPFAVSEHARDTLKDAGYDVTLRHFVGGHRVPKDQLGFVAKWIRKVNP